MKILILFYNLKVVRDILWYMVMPQGETVTGQLICRHSDIAKLSFTGSISTGIKVMEAAAQASSIFFLDYLFVSNCNRRVAKG